MKQILQNLRTGETLLAEVPVPKVKSGALLIRTEFSLISLGTERMLVQFGKSNFLQKAFSQPDKVRQVLNKAKTDGILSTVEAVRDKLDQKISLGYCNAGVVVETGPRAEGYSPGDRVVSNGFHAEYVVVSKNLVCPLPREVEAAHGPFAIPGAIALHGIRLLEPTLGERFVVLGLGLVGQLAVQLLQAHGARVLGVDLDPKKCQLAESFGIQACCSDQGESLEAAARGFSDGRGIDGVLITASSTSSDPVNQAAMICRKRGRVVQVGATGLQLQRDPFYQKEIRFQVSCSYGPGRYDSDYEEAGVDYPFPYVRWTEQRNIAAVLEAMANKQVRVEPLISTEIRLDEAPEIYRDISRQSHLGIVLRYPGAEGHRLPAPAERVVTNLDVRPRVDMGRRPRVAVIGAGMFTGRTLIPALMKTGVEFHTIVSSGGVSAFHLGKKFGFHRISTETDGVFLDPAVDAVFVTTRHNTHARFVIQALKAGKHVFVEKPLCLTEQELAEICSVREICPEPLLMVGFNRRFSPFTQQIRHRISSVREPKTLILTVNAGVLPHDHWHHDPAIGGGRIVAEGCHFIDLVRYLTGHPIVAVQASMIGRSPFSGIRNDKMTITLRLADGSLGTVHYFGNGARDYPKEKVEVFCDGKVLAIDNYLRLRGYGWPDFRGMWSIRQKKGHAEEIAAFVEAVRKGTPSPIPFDEIVEVTRITFEAVKRAEGVSLET